MYIKDYIKLSLKHLLRCNFIIRKYIKEIDCLFNMSDKDLLAWKEKRFLEIFRKAYDKSSFYNKLYTEAGIKKEDIQSLKDIVKLPIVTKEMVRKHSKEMLTVPIWQVISASTSGTTGTPLKLYEDMVSIWKEQAYLYSNRKRCGFTIGEKLVSLRGHLDRNVKHLYLDINNTLYLSSYNINQENVELFYKLMSEFKPKAIEGYPSSLYNLALIFKDNNLSLNVPICFTSSETLLDNQRIVIENVFNTEIFDMYGMTERTINLMENSDHSGYYESPGYSINEFTEEGEICTSLINDSFPMIRYESHDIIEFEDDNRTKIKRILGRTEDIIICKDGSKIKRLDFLFKEALNVKMAQLVQYKSGELIINIVPEEGFNKEDELGILKILNDRVGVGNLNTQIRLIKEDEIIYSSRNKFKFIISKIEK